MEKFKEVLKKRRHIQFFEKPSKTIENFSASEKVIFYFLVAVFIASGLALANRVNLLSMLRVPANGGYLKEGIVGSPRFVNPVLAVSDVDHDLTELIYSGLMKATLNNDLVTDLAKDYTVSTDGLTYTFTIRDNAYFQDGQKVTADDIIFTINKIQDSSIKSPKRAAFYDVLAEKISDREVQFTLKKPYAPFLQNLTVGILPKHLWDNLAADEFPQSQYNVESIGSGPYKISDMQTLKKNMLLIPTYYELTPFSGYTLGKPYIDKLFINFYRDEKTLIDAYNTGDIEAINSISPDKIAMIKKKLDTEVKTAPLPRVFTVFFNQNQSEVLANKEVRQALDMAVDRNTLVKEVLGGYGTPLYGPIPVGLIADENQKPDNYTVDAAKAVLQKAGWTFNGTTSVMEKTVNKKKKLQLIITIATLNSPDLEKAAQIIQKDWQALGARVDIKEFDFESLQQNIIRPRKFDALLYGLVIGRDMDFFAFWHSSQRNDPGLNISMYANSKVDKLLEDARKTLDTSVRIEKYLSFADELKKDVPAVFLYSPDFTYILPNKIKGFDMDIVTLPFERFLNVHKWYIETNNLWKVFTR